VLFRSNLSYFAGDADLNSGHTLLSGDGNLMCNPMDYSATTRTLSVTNAFWYITVHNQAGNILLSDGSTAACSNRDVTNYIGAALVENPTGSLRISVPLPY
jgi:hypothetical protein